jgi:DNA-binding NtrC family response regulator
VPLNVLVVDDDPSVTASLALTLKQSGHASATAATPDEALQRLSHQSFDLVLQDMNFSRSTSGEEGLSLLKTLRAAHPELPVILMTAWGSVPLAVEGMKAGAADFVTKPWSNAQLLQTIETIVALREKPPAQKTRAELDAQYDFAMIIGSDPKIVRVLELVARVAPTDASVLITGESGTGKERIAEAIHRNSRRRSAPFVKVNLGGISSTLFESEMFGHVRGAFTDARADRKGRFEVADGGTIFLDEIGEIDANSQVKLLRVLQDRTYEVLGSSRTRTVDVRVISATNRPLHELVAGGSFREDLLYRLNLITIHLPPLRERRGDIRLLAEHFLVRCASTYGREHIELTPRALQWLQSQPWPGNVRQLMQTIERTVLIVEGDRLDAHDFASAAEIGSEVARKPSALPEMTLEEMEKAMIVKCLRQYEGNVSRVAEALGISRAALYRRFEKYGLNPDDASPAS